MSIDDKCENIFDNVIDIMPAEDVVATFELRHYKATDLNDDLKVIVDYFALGQDMTAVLSLYYMDKEVYKRVSIATGDDEPFYGNVTYPIYVPGEWVDEIIDIIKDSKAKSLNLQFKCMTRLCNKINGTK